MDTWLWTWVGLAAVLIVAEVFTQSFFKGAFGISAIVAGALAWFGVDPTWQLVSFVVVALPLLALARRLVNARGDGPVEHIAAERLIDRVGVVIHAIRPHQSGGLVRVDREEWSAQSDDDAPIADGAEIRVVRVEGVRLIVQRTQTN